MDNQQTIDQTAIWQALTQHQKSFQPTHLKDLFADDPQRGTRFSVEAAGIYFDYSKNHLTETTLGLFEKLADEVQLSQHIDALFSGFKVNQSEDRPALHTALRQGFQQQAAPNNDHAIDKDTRQEIKRSLAQTLEFAEALRKGSVLGSGGQPITDVINLGIGGSDLGPRLVVDALADTLKPGATDNPQVHFVANIDSDALNTTLQQCTPATTLFIISSKSFTTLETLSNAELARTWLLSAGIPEDQLKTHFVAITSQVDKALTWGVDQQAIFTTGDEVGGRFSLWSAIGLPIAIALGSAQFRELLAGAAAMDSHFQNASLRENLPVLHGLINVWQINFWHCKSRAILPYVHKLKTLPDYLQQLLMESLGKSVTQTGQALKLATGQVIWGSEESNGQHSFHQLLLQGTETIPADFIVTRQAHCSTDQHRQLYANCLAQSQILMLGTADDGLPNYRAISGNRPSNTLVLNKLSPHCLGALLALYEHSVYVQSVVWGINAFDQWGVEQGKQISAKVANTLQTEAEEQHDEALEQTYDSSTRALIQRYRKDP
ncbi:MAG: glucose-6-phosphate isomerase [Porticoccaceae bacterium]|nr:glucose-6-phosphate isomerase [Porticoccaceae bacterium]